MAAVVADASDSATPLGSSGNPANAGAMEYTLAIVLTGGRRVCGVTLVSYQQSCCFCTCSAYYIFTSYILLSLYYLLTFQFSLTHRNVVTLNRHKLFLERQHPVFLSVCLSNYPQDIISFPSQVQYKFCCSCIVSPLRQLCGNILCRAVIHNPGRYPALAYRRLVNSTNSLFCLHQSVTPALPALSSPSPSMECSGLCLYRNRKRTKQVMQRETESKQCTCKL